jgi:hypothetical protein
MRNRGTLSPMNLAVRKPMTGWSFALPLPQPPPPFETPW